ncbi:GGDEF domain-containing protein [Magnetococcus sp. PR-3]|uniref:GGDEF domain-containing protein n=1 Tax=Magnetococcus sp. PR-3 TaxID=3120355 RepID=UPI002FCE46C1
MQMKAPHEANAQVLAGPCNFTTPPETLGHAVSVYTSLSQDPEVFPLEKRKKFILVATGMALFVGVLVDLVVNPFPDSLLLTLGWPILAALLSAWTVAVNTNHKHYCTFAATRGAMHTEQQGLFPAISSNSFHFETAKFLVKHHHTHAVASHYLFHAVEDEEFHFRWVDDQHHVLHQIDGLNDHRNSFSEPLQNYYFGSAVELNWTRYLLRQHGADIRNGTAIRFPLNERGNDYIELSGERFRYAIKDEEGEHGYEEVAESFRGERDFDIGIYDLENKGELQGHQWIKFPYPAIPNELLFMKLWELRTGTKVEVHHLLPEAETFTKDPVTDLILSALFLERLEQSISRHARRDTTLAVLIVEVANIAFIKHALGREAGVEVLKTLAKRMKSAVRRGDTVGRLWRDEFGITLTDLKAEALEQVIEGIREELIKPIPTPRGDAYAELHLGWAIYPENGNNNRNLLRHARYQAYQNRIDAVLEHPEL